MLLDLFAPIDLIRIWGFVTYVQPVPLRYNALLHARWGTERLGSSLYTHYHDNDAFCDSFRGFVLWCDSFHDQGLCANAMRPEEPET
jgi:hypothetical protein